MAERTELAVIIMGSEGDKEHPLAIKEELMRGFGIPALMRICSAHKEPERLQQILDEYNGFKRLVYIAVAGMSNGLGGTMETSTTHPVISSPPLNPKLRDPWEIMDIFSSIRNPSGVGSMFVLGAKQTALAVAKIFALDNPNITDKIEAYQAAASRKNEISDENILAEQSGLIAQLRLGSLVNG